MRAEPVTIDLGVYPFGSDADPGHDAGPEPPWPWWRRLRRSGATRWAPAVLATLLLGSLGGAAAPAEPPLALLWTVPGDISEPYGQIAVGEQDLYTVARAADVGR
jgi:hypothetical protein